MKKLILPLFLYVCLLYSLNIMNLVEVKQKDEFQLKYYMILGIYFVILYLKGILSRTYNRMTFRRIKQLSVTCAFGLILYLSGAIFTYFINPELIIPVYGFFNYQSVLLILLGIVLMAIVDGIFFRKLLIDELSDVVGLTFAIIFSATLYGFLFSFNFVNFIPRYFLGISLALTYYQYRDIKVNIGAHVLINVMLYSF